MKSILKVIAALCIAAICVGFVYDHLTQEENLQTMWYVETVHSGDTFNGIVGQYYDETIRVNKSWDEWQTQQKEYNQKLFANGRCLQPGDKILIVTKVRVAK